MMWRRSFRRPGWAGLPAFNQSSRLVPPFQARVVKPRISVFTPQRSRVRARISAAHAAIALNAKRLVFMSDVPGLMRNPKDPATLITHLQTSEVPGLKQAGIVDKGMIPKVDSAVTAIKSGVEKVSFVDGRVNHSVLLEIFTDEGVGTEVVL